MPAYHGHYNNEAFSKTSYRVLPVKNPYRFATPIYVTRPSMPDKAHFLRYIDSIWDSACLSNFGPLHNEFEQALVARLGVDHICLTGNGHLALDAAIKSLVLQGEIITSPYTFSSTTSVIIENHLQPVFCDIKSGSPNIDAGQVEALITENTSAILAVHAYGYPCDVELLEQIASKYSLKLIYDAAHAFGVEYRGRSLMAYGDASILSFHATKVLSAGEGGAVCCATPVLKQAVRRHINFGYDPVGESPISVGGNAKLSELHAALALANLGQIGQAIDQRKAIAQRYDELLQDVAEIVILKLEQEGPGVHNYAYYPIRLNLVNARDAREEILRTFANYNIFPRKYFSPLTTEYVCYRDYSFYQSKFPHAKKLADSVLCLPIFPELKIEEVENIVAVLKFALQSDAVIFARDL